MKNLFGKISPYFVEKLDLLHVSLMVARLQELTANIPKYPSSRRLNRKNFNQAFKYPNVINFTLELLNLIFSISDSPDLCIIFECTCREGWTCLDRDKNCYSINYKDKYVCVQDWELYHLHLKEIFFRYTDVNVYQQALHEREVYERNINVETGEIIGLEELEDRNSIEIDVGIPPLDEPGLENEESRELDVWNLNEGIGLSDVGHGYITEERFPAWNRNLETGDLDI